LTLAIDKPFFQLENVEDGPTRFHFDQIRLWVERLSNEVSPVKKTGVQQGVTDFSIGDLVVRNITARIESSKVSEYSVDGKILHASGVYSFFLNAGDTPVSELRTIASSTETMGTTGVRFSRSGAATSGSRKIAIENTSASRYGKVNLFLVFVKDGVV